MMERNEELHASLFSSGIVRLRAHLANPFHPCTWTNALFPSHKPKPQKTETLLRSAKLKLLECVQQPQTKQATYTPIFPPSLPFQPSRTYCRGQKPLKVKPVSELIMQSNNDMIKLVQHRRLSPQTKDAKRPKTPPKDGLCATYKSKEAAALRFRRRRTGSVQLNSEDIQTFKTAFVPVKRSITTRNVLCRRRSIAESSLTFGHDSGKDKKNREMTEDGQKHVPKREKMSRMQRRASLSAWVSAAEAEDSGEVPYAFIT